MQQRSDIMAQAVFLAQLEAAKNNCKCKTCQILRRASDLMTAQFLKPPVDPSQGLDQLPRLTTEVTEVGVEP
jgi:hypothetical protein